ncbi:MAG: helix-turn-helix transcriptional regulator [Ramlibacter sp.]|nr:helix-turn-helix transcriptional regulator [Ramlibacter sp.]
MSLSTNANPWASLFNPLAHLPPPRIVQQVAAIVRAPQGRAPSCVIPPAEPNPWGLTAMQCHLIKCLIAGKSGRGLAREMGLSPRTIESHSTVLRRKMGAKSMVQAAAMWTKHKEGT